MNPLSLTEHRTDTIPEDLEACTGTVGGVTFCGRGWSSGAPAAEVEDLDVHANSALFCVCMPCSHSTPVEDLDVRVDSAACLCGNRLNGGLAESL